MLYKNYINNFKKNFKNYSLLEKSIFFIILLLPIFFLAGSALINIAVVLVIVKCGILIYRNKDFDILNNRILIILSILSLIFFSLSIFSLNPQISILRSFNFLKFIIFSFLIFYYFNKFHNIKKFILNFWSLIIIIVTFDILFEFLMGYNILGFVSSYPGRIASFLNDELKIGHFYSALLFIAISTAIKNSQKLLTILILLILGIIISFLIGERANFIKTFLIWLNSDRSH